MATRIRRGALQVTGADAELTTWLREADRVLAYAPQRHVPPRRPVAAADVRAAIDDLVPLHVGPHLPSPALRVEDPSETDPYKHTRGTSLAHRVAHALGYEHR